MPRGRQTARDATRGRDATGNGRPPRVCDVWTMSSTGHQQADSRPGTAWRHARDRALNRQFGAVGVAAERGGGGRADVSVAQMLRRPGLMAKHGGGQMAVCKEKQDESRVQRGTEEKTEKRMDDSRVQRGTEAKTEKRMDDSRVQRGTEAKTEKRMDDEKAEERIDDSKVQRGTEDKTEKRTDDSRLQRGTEDKIEKRIDDPRLQRGTEAKAEKRIDDPRLQRGTEEKTEKRIDDPRLQRGTEAKAEEKIESIDSPPTRILAGVVVHINGSTNPQISLHRLRLLLAHHGALSALHLARRRVTHVILGQPATPRAGAGGGLAAAKLQREIRRSSGCAVKYVGVEWILESIKAGKRLPEARFAIVPTGGARQPSVYQLYSQNRP
ncbi:hypothetical protein CDD81_5289 [Ophiocordyceps australis]|uniref:BRCT domain-containing protein n=1 Tax=Ophiocordyceps australis TaxID=1399860 RepID=A0A2C5YDZ4_9HYPO|nr:hypothetical protein CDD81_5289 [Ophiocordyceps australis]